MHILGIISIISLVINIFINIYIYINSCKSDNGEPLLMTLILTTGHVLTLVFVCKTLF